MAKNIISRFLNTASKSSDIVNHVIDKVDKRIDSTLKSIKERNEKTLSFPYDSSQCTYEKAKDLAQKLLAIGFTNITMIALGDLKGNFLDRGQDGKVAEVLLNGKSSFKKHKGLNRDAAIVISFHSIRGMLSTEPYTLPVPRNYTIEQSEPEIIDVTPESVLLEDNDTPQRKFCPFCGSRLNENAHFCSECGHSMD